LVATKAEVKVWKVEMTDSTRLKNRMGVISGRVILKNCLTLPAPSISAAS